MDNPRSMQTCNSSGKSVETMTMTEVTMWLKEAGFSEDVLSAFEDQEMDGDAICAAFASSPGPDTLRDLIPKLGIRLKVYRMIKSALDQQYTVQVEGSPRCSGTIPSSGATPSSITSLASGSTVSVCSSNSPECSLSQQGSHVQQSKVIHTPFSKSKVPNPFPIPKFRQHTQQNLEKGLMGDDDRKYIVTMLGTVLVTYVQRASRKDCLTVAESLVRKFPFLKDPYSWQNFIYTKCQNLNRCPKKMEDCNEPKQKRIRYSIESKTCHTYPTLEADTEDDVSHQRNIGQMKKLLEKSKPNHTILKDLMQRTFKKRRSLIIEEAKPVVEICDEYPLLRKSNYVSLEMDLVLKYECGDMFEEKWDMWCEAVIQYALQTKHQPVELKHALQDLESGFVEKCSITAFRCLGYFLRTKKRGETQHGNTVDVPFLLCQAPRGMPLEEAVDTSNNQPHIIQFVDTADENFSPQYFIVIEQTLFIECKTIKNALFILFAVHYVFNLEYNVRVKDFYRFIQEYIMGIPDGSKRSVNFANICTSIESFISS